MHFPPSSLVGLVYPTFATFKLIDSSADASVSRACLTYWTVFGLFTLCEGLVTNLLSWVPLYSIARVGFQVWLIAVNFAGAATVYNLAVVPVLIKVSAVVAQVSKELKASDKAAAK